MLIKTRGIVLRAIKYSETSLITDIYTEEKGLQKYIISGVRSKKAKVNASLLQVMSLLELVAYHREGRDLHRVREIRPAHLYQAIPFDIRRGAVGLFMAEIARKTIRETEENRELFRFLYHSFYVLDSTNLPVANLHLYFLTRLASYLGFAPGGDFCPESPYFDLQEGIFVTDPPLHAFALDMEKSELLYQLLCSSPEEAQKIKLSAPQRRLLLREMLNFYKLHIENLPEINSHQILQEILE